MGRRVFIQRQNQKNANGTETKNKKRLLICYCLRGRPWIRLEIKKLAMGRVFIQALRQRTFYKSYTKNRGLQGEKVNKKRVLICYCLRGRPWIRLEIHKIAHGS